MEREALIFQFDDVRVDAANAQVWKAGRSVALEPKALRVLVFLLERPGRLVEKEELLSSVWANTFVTENALTRCIALLRKVLGDSKGEAKYIETVPTRGYRFIAPVRVETASPNGAVGTITAREAGTSPRGEISEIRQSPQPRARSGSIPRWAVLALLTLVGVASAIFVANRYLDRATANDEAKPDFTMLQVTNSTGIELFPSFSPDGNTVAYSSNEKGVFEIYLKQLARGGSVVQLTKDGGPNLHAAWSPDGTTIAYYSAAKGGIWLIPALGGVARQLTTFGSSPAWSPDGAKIAFESEGSTNIALNASVSISGATLWTANVADGTLRQLTQMDQPRGAHNAPTWSPDGKTIGFVTNGFQSNGLWTLQLADGRITKLADGNYFNPVFAKDGQHLYVASDFALWKTAVDGPRDEKGYPEHSKLLDLLPEASRYLAVSSDGRKLAFSRLAASSNIYSLPMSGNHAAGQPIALTHDTRQRKTNATISFDGRRVLFEVGSVDRNGGVWVMDADGQNARPVLVPCQNPRWLPGNEDFLCTEFVPVDGPECKQKKCWTAEVEKVHLATGAHETVMKLGEDGFFFRYSRDGKQVAFMSIRNGPPNVYVAALEEGVPRQVTFDRVSIGFPTWAPDGRTLAVEQKVGDDTRICLLKPGEKPVELTHDEGQSWPASFSPDGDKIAFAAQRKGVWNLWWVSRRDGTEKQLTFYRDANEYVRYPDWSPDGKSIVYEYAETTGNIWLLEFR